MTTNLDAFKTYTDARKSPKTTSAYVYIVGKYLSECKGTINRETAIAFISDLEINHRSPQTIRTYFSALRYYFKFLARADELDDYEMPRIVAEKTDALTKEQVMLLMARSRNLKEKSMVSLLYDCALRIGELLQIQIDDIGKKEGYLAVHTEKRRTADDVKDFVPIGDATVELLAQYITEYGITAGPIFPGMKYITALKNIQRIARRCGIESIKTHSFRHARATHLADTDIPPLKLQAFMRHSQFSSTQKYIHTTDASVKDAVAPGFATTLVKPKEPVSEAK